MKKNTIIKLLNLVFLTAIVCLSFVDVNSQERRVLTDKTYQIIKAWKGGERKLNPNNYPSYFGIDISAGVPQFIFESDIQQLNKVNASFFGPALGVMWATPVVKMRAQAGIFLNDSSVPHTMTLFQECLSGNLYLLRMFNVKFRTLEPYLSTGFSFRQTLLFGNFLEKESTANNSTMHEKMLGTINSLPLNFGGGIEYQLQDFHHHFIHIYGEINYTFPLTQSATNAALSNTKLTNGLMFSLGFGLGIVKSRTNDKGRTKLNNRKK